MTAHRPPSDADVPRASRTYRAAAAVAFAVMDIQQWAFDVRSSHHLPWSGGAVIAANHTSFWDFFVVGRPAYHGLARPVRILAKDSLFEKPLFGPVMRAAEHIPVHRARGAAALSSAITALRRGEFVLVLPEQTISPAFELLPFKTGAARMAALAGVPLIPAASWGTHRFHTVQRRPVPRWRLPVSIAFGEPLRPAPDDDAGDVTDELHGAVQTLADELVLTYPGGAPAGAWWVPARFGGGAPAPHVGLEYVDRIRRTRFDRRSA